MKYGGHLCKRWNKIFKPYNNMDILDLEKIYMDYKIKYKMTPRSTLLKMGLLFKLCCTKD